jgi:hypothetical protein
LDSRRCINFGIVEDCSQKELRLGFFRNHEQSHGWISLIPVEGNFTLWVLQLQHNVQARGRKRKKRKTEQSDNSSDVYYLGSLCFVKVSEMVKKMCSTVFFPSSTRWGISMDGCSYGDMISACHLPSFSFCDDSSVYNFQALDLLLFQCTLFCVQLLIRCSSYLQILLLIRGPDFSLRRKISLYPP